MPEKDGECPKCGGDVEAGFLLDTSFLRMPGSGSPLLWVEADQIGMSTRVRPGDPGQIEVDAQRCLRCGFIELYAGIGDPDRGRPTP